ncbi:polymorphic toxin-type HINT domain-containing protein [Kitasatospora sp. NPDC008050]|uniref:polymorphic toxin-type HINT domain-containing protein n=1 Tax=Kitasatospora sp. NPDC008050 TaxID=3364021 RepID=UPI0036DFB81C
MATLAVVLAMMVGLPASALAASGSDPAKVWVPPQTPLGSGTKAVKGGQLKVTPLKQTPSSPVPPEWTPDKSTPAPTGSATVTVGADSAEARAARAATGGGSPASGGSTLVQAGQLPVAVAPKDGGAVTTSVKVQVTDEAAGKAAGVTGPLVALTDVTSGASSGAVKVALDLKALQGQGLAADRTSLVALPACALTTPAAAECRKQTPVTTSSDVPSGQVSADIALPTGSATKPATGAVQSSYRTGTVQASSAAAAPMVLAAVAGASGSGGNYAATPLSPSAAWAAGSNVGNFTYSYPIQLPAGLGGLTPTVGLSYDSSAVDGKTSATNAQASWIGDGWDYQPGFIERSYKGCGTDGITGSGDLCWGGQNAMLSLAGHSGALVRDDASGAWHLQGDDGSKVEQLTGAPNGLNNGEYWRVTTPDGTQYYFGQNHLPGGDGSDPASNSAWGEPVFSPNGGDPCNSSAGQASWCTMGWRWNLDYVVDTHQNLIAYAYATEANSYSLGAGQNNGNGTLTSYVRGGYPTQISYGQRLPEQVAAHGSLNPAAKVVFNTAERCLPSGSITCDPSQRTKANATFWPDVPLDQACDASAPCTVTSPTFFSTKRLTGISTVVYVNSAPVTVDTWALTQSFPDPGDGTKPALWLASVQRTGSDGQPGVTLPPVTFTAKEMPNRVDGLVPAAPIFNRPRIQMITTETGGQISVVYSNPTCSRLNGPMPGPEAGNKLPCMPVKWYLPGSSSPDPVLDWFNKPLVTDINEQDAVTGQGLVKATHYTYNGDAAWHRNDAEFTDPKTRTWDNFRGYQSVTTTTGSGYGGEAPRTQSTVTYLRGMDGDIQSDGTSRSITVTNPLDGSSVTDSNWLAGQVLASQTFDQAGGNVVLTTSGTTNGQQVTSTHKQSGGMPDLVARYAATQSTAKTLAKRADGSPRTTTKVTTSDPAHGNRTLQVDDQGDGTATTPELCSTTSYASGGNAMMLDSVSELKVVSGPCGAVATAANTVSDNRTLYDGQPFGQLGAAGDPTSTQVLDHYDGNGNPVFVKKGSITVDAYGRPLTAAETDGSTYDGSGNQLSGPSVAAPATTTTAFTPATGAIPTGTSVTGPMGAGWTTTTTQDPGRGLPLTSTDVNGNKTSEAYDALGRLTAVWLPGRTTGQNPNEKYSYAVNGLTGPSVVTTLKLESNDVDYLSQTDLYDGLGRLRQTQAQSTALTAGALITDKVYDSHGWVTKTSDPYYETQSPPGASIFSAQNDSQIPSETWISYDGQGRKVRSEFRSYAQLQWATVTAYPGTDRTDVTPPSGTAPTSTFTDVRGRTTALWQYHGSTPTGNASDAEVTSYTYTAAGQPATRSDAVGNTWTYQYDLHGRQTSATDPDTGTSQTFYDVNSRVDHTVDARGTTLAYTYDLLGRKTGMYNGGVAPANEAASWSYDTLAKGQLTSSTRYVGGASGAAYTETVTGYDSAYRSLGTSTTIPSAEGALAGTYTDTSTYEPILGTLATQSYPAMGGLAAETVGYKFSDTGLLEGTKSLGLPVISDMQYDAMARPVRTTVSPYGVQVVSTQQYDWSTGRVIQSFVDRQIGTKSVDQTSYTYNPAGMVTSATDVQDANATDTQCFTYDPLGRLTNAWADTGSTNTTADWTDSTGTVHGTGSSNTVPGIGGCNNVGGPAVSVGKTSVGGPAPYWQSYSYDQTGNRTKLVQHDVTGDLSKDLTTTQTFPAAGTVNSGSGGPHALQSSQRSTSAGASAASTDTYDKAGNTTQVSNPVGNLVMPAGTTLTAGQSVSSNAATLMMQTDGNLVLTSKRTGNVLWADNNSYGHPGSWATMQPDGNLVVYDANHSPLWSSVTWGNSGAYAVVQDDGNLVVYSAGAKSALWNANTANFPDAANGATLTWDAENRLASTTVAGAATSYLYDADGNQLIRRDPGSTTINLGADELTLNTNTKSLSDVRTLAAVGGLSLTRVTAAVGGGTVFVDAADPHGTNGVQIGTDPNQSVTRRMTDPFGNTRGKATPTSAWAGDKGFVGGTADTATELTNLGAREYQASTGRFLNPDPLLDTADPQQWNGYAYSNNDPVSSSDPSGKKYGPDFNGGDRGDSACDQACQAGIPADYLTHRPVVDSQPTTSGNGSGSGGNGGGHKTPSLWGRIGSAISTGASWVNKHKATIASDVASGVTFVGCWSAAGLGAPETGGASLALGAAGCGAAAGAAGAAWHNQFSPKNKHQSLLGGAADGAAGALVGEGAGTLLRPLASKFVPALADDGSALFGDCPVPNSFLPGTLVLLANGATKAIDKLAVGDKVTATDPQSGLTTAEPITDTIVTPDDKDFTDLTLVSTTAKSPETGTPSRLIAITSTQHHPYWDGTTQKWTDAADLHQGDQLRAADGSTVVVQTVRNYHTAPQTTFNLTVDQLHTYYVLAGETPVLVHNATPGQKCDLTLGAGPNARAGVALENGDIEADGVRDLINESGNAHGCHTCPATTPGTKHGDWIPDHQPPSSLVPPGSPQTAYPHCLPCARRQGGVVSQLFQERSTKEW